MDNKSKTSALIVILILFSLSLSILGLQSVLVSANSSPVDRAVNLVLTVDPDGWIAMEGAVDDTTTTTAASSINFTMYGDIAVTESGLTTSITLLIPTENATKIPFDSSSYSLLLGYDEGRLDVDCDWSMVLSSKEVLSTYIPDVETLEMLESFLNSSDFTFDAIYEDGDVDFSLHHVTVANITDLIGSLMGMTLGLEAPFTVDLNYSKGEYDGSVQVSLTPGFPVGDLEMDLAGNLTDVCLNGTVAVTYGTYFDTEINSTFLDLVKDYSETVFNASIDQEGSLLNMTDGEMECTYVSVEIDPIDSVGADVTYRVCVRAEDGFVWLPLLETTPSGYIQSWLFLSLNATLYEIEDAEIRLVYSPADTKLDVTIDGTFHFRNLIEHLLDPVAVPDEWQGLGLPPEFNSTNLPYIWLEMEILNTTAYSLEDASLHIAYSHDSRRAEMNFTALTEVDELSEDLYRLFSELTPEQEAGLELPPEFVQLWTSISTIRYANITVIDVSSTYANGEAALMVVLTFEGDINAEINYLKSVFFNYLNETVIESAPWQAFYLNSTEIDITGMKGWVKMDNMSTEVTFEGIEAKPPIDLINATAFKLDIFFNLTADETFPEQGEQLNVTIIGGRNATHKVTIHNDTGVPEPDLALFDANNRPILMAWDNVSLSDLRKLQFIISERTLLAVTLNTPTSEGITETSISLSWTESENPDFVRYEIFRSTSSNVLGTSIANITNRENTTYEASDQASGTTYYFTVRVVDSFSVYADSNQVIATTKIPIWAQGWFIASIGGVITIAAVAVFLTRRRGNYQKVSTKFNMLSLEFRFHR